MDGPYQIADSRSAWLGHSNSYLGATSGSTVDRVGKQIVEHPPPEIFLILNNMQTVDQVGSGNLWIDRVGKQIVDRPTVRKWFSTTDHMYPTLCGL